MGSIPSASIVALIMKKKELQCMAPQESIHPTGEAMALSFGVGIIMKKMKTAFFKPSQMSLLERKLLSTVWQ